jgi:RNA polymerase sigma-70 factor (ECF subfamily)
VDQGDTGRWSAQPRAGTAASAAVAGGHVPGHRDGPAGGLVLPESAKAALVERAMAGSRPAMEELWRVHRRWVAAVILAHKPASAEVDDILQDVAASMVANISQVGEPGAFPGWLRTVAVNAARLAGRKASSGLARLGRVTGDAGEAALHAAARSGPDAGPAAGLAAHAPLDPERLLELARRLPEGYAEALLLRALQGLSYAEIGAVLGLPESTVETRIARGRRMLRELATGAAGGGAPTGQGGAGRSSGGGRPGANGADGIHGASADVGRGGGGQAVTGPVSGRIGP